ALATFAGLDTRASREEIVRALYPELAGKQLTEEPPLAPTSVEIEISGFPSYRAGVPVDWWLDPYDDPSWRMFFQSLEWTSSLEAESAIVVVSDWVSSQLLEHHGPEFQWGDHAIALRINRARRLIERYIVTSERPSLPALWAASKVIATHLYALATDTCYTRGHNHGVMQDRAILRTVLRSPTIANADGLWSLAANRFGEQAIHAVTSEGVHVENSTGYHAFFMGLSLEMVELLRRRDTPVEEAILALAPRMAAVMAQLLQPNKTFPQLGDTENLEVAEYGLSLVERIRGAGLGGSGADELEWVLTDGALGSRPSATDAVYRESGYAIFRDDWDRGRDAISAHFTCAKLSKIHYQRDETSFSIYGHGRELIVDPGLYGYRDDPLTRYSRGVFGHNVLVVDDHDHEARGTSRIENYSISERLSWVRGAHDHYQDLGVRRLARTFAHGKPNVFLVVDHVDADGSHRLDQQLLLHPDLEVLSRPAPQTVVLGPGGESTPALVVTTLPGAVIEIHRGTAADADAPPRGWWFPSFGVEVPTHQLVVHWQHDGGSSDLPLLVAVLAPATEHPDVVLTTFESSGAEVRLEWAIGGESASAQLPTGR
ncbi:MAG: heparinase II/III-family protein, partial [Deltaproteobacteria bacterium]|nr:heparinase II/III-family protein [Deltaproteobacteria bacterium]